MILYYDTYKKRWTANCKKRAKGGQQKGVRWTAKGGKVDSKRGEGGQPKFTNFYKKNDKIGIFKKRWTAKVPFFEKL